MAIFPGIENYPKVVALRHGTKVHLRPLEREDEIRLLRFFLRVPEADRYYLKEDVTDPDVIREWTRHIDFDRIMPVVALLDDEVIADATLHTSRSPARRHVGDVRIVVDPAYRGRGLARGMLDELVGIAGELGLDRVVFEAVEQQEEAAIAAAKKMGFSVCAVLGSRVIDLWGEYQNLVVLERPTVRFSRARDAEHRVEASNRIPAASLVDGRDGEHTVTTRQHSMEDDPPEGLELPGPGAPVPKRAAESGRYQGAVVVQLRTSGNAKQATNFLNELGAMPEIRLLKIEGGLRKATLFLQLRRQLCLREVFGKMKSVADVIALPAPSSGHESGSFEVVLRGEADSARDREAWTAWSGPRSLRDDDRVCTAGTSTGDRPVVTYGRRAQYWGHAGTSADVCRRVPTYGGGQCSRINSTPDTRRQSHSWKVPRRYSVLFR